MPGRSQPGLLAGLFRQHHGDVAGQITVFLGPGALDHDRRIGVPGQQAFPAQIQHRLRNQFL